MEIFLLATGLALGISFLCSLLEASVLSLTPGQVAQMEGTSPRAAVIWKRFKAAIDKPIAVILVLNTTAHTIGATIAGAEFTRHFGEDYLIVFSILFTLAMLQFTEVLPKTLGVRYNANLAPVIARPLDLLARLFSPLIGLIHLLNRPFQGKAKPEDHGAASLAEMASMAKLARSSRTINVHEQRLITGATALRKVRAVDLMVPRSSMVTVRDGVALGQTLRALRADCYSHMPVLDRSGTDFTGFVAFEDLVFLHQDRGDVDDLSPLLRKIQRIPAQTHAGDLLALFSESGDPIALVVEDGRVLGLIALMDVIEELLGELHDRDELPRTCQVRPGALYAGGGMAMGDLVKRCSATWAQADDQTQLADWLEERLGDPLALGRVWSEGDARFTVRRLRRGRIAEVEVRLPQPQATQA